MYCFWASRGIALPMFWLAAHHHCQISTHEILLHLQWNIGIKYSWVGPGILSFIMKLSSLQGLKKFVSFVEKFLLCPLLGASFIACHQKFIWLVAKDWVGFITCQFLHPCNVYPIAQVSDKSVYLDLVQFSSA